MSSKGGGIEDDFDKLLKQVAGLSDQDLEQAMAGMDRSPRKPGAIEDFEPGKRLRGVVVDVRGGEVLVELDGKSLGVIDAEEFATEGAPRVGSEISAEFVRHDDLKGVVVLSAKGVRREVVWDELRAGAVLEGNVVAVNKGGLTLDVKGVRAFLPISQIELERVEDLTPYLGRKFCCEVMSFDRGAQNLVLTRRPILERAAEEGRTNAMARLGEGEVLSGTVVRITDHGAFIDLGGVDGLLHASKIRQRVKAQKDGEPLRVGQRITVEVVHVDRERGRVGLDFKRLEPDSFGRAVDDYKVGDEVTGWVSKSAPEGVVVSLDEGVQGFIPRESILDLEVESGAIVKAVVTAVDAVKRQITLRPALTSRS